MAGRLRNEQFLCNFGGLENNDLTQILNCDSDIDENAATIINVSNYHDLDDLLNKAIFKKSNHFKVLGFNSESIFSKLDSIKLFLESLKQKEIFFEAICINECWLESFGEDLHLNGYSAFPLPRITGMKGGLVTYILEDYKVKELSLYEDSESWEGQFLEIHGNGLRSKLLLSNLYVPPRTTNEFKEFEDSFLPIVRNLAHKYKHMIIIGDTNANALECNSNEVFSNYFDNIISNGLLPVITLPTHFGTKNGSIIDHIYVKTDMELSTLYTGILLHKFSNHLPVFTCIPLKNEIVELPKYINITCDNPLNWENLNNELNEINWSQVFNTDNLFSNPSINCAKFVDKIIELKNKHLPTKKVRFKRYKHKNNGWITHGLLKSIKQKDFLYKKLHSLKKSNPNYETLKKQFKSYEKTLKSLISFLKKDFYKRQFLRYRTDIKKHGKLSSLYLIKIDHHASHKLNSV